MNEAVHHHSGLIGTHTRQLGDRPHGQLRFGPSQGGQHASLHARNHRRNGISKVHVSSVAFFRTRVRFIVGSS